MSLPILLEGLKELAPALKIHGCPLIIAGGCGLYPRQSDLENQQEIDTIVPPEECANSAPENKTKRQA